ncbi:hypothetical protein GT347_21755 [Xylophilus rhododendri]|uniref:Iron uptake protein n=1 Tax=Xylophilus rhododendri TaxID=2697032 RepID=A0A857JB52_9BURK|nr:hypothetical protein [Xylophilus rhododendri]QHJ00372.1 hypothetical protein GT347_21755 [Xylophilus rhododendri]
MRLSLLLRLLAAVGGGFGVTTLAVLLLAGLLARAGMAGAEAVTAACLAGFLLYLGLLLWGLAHPSFVRLCAGLGISAAGLAALLRWAI